MNLVEILKDCPKGTKLYTPIWGEVTFIEVEDKDYVYPICIYTNTCTKVQLTKNGCFINSTDSECILFPSKEQRNWNKFTAPWYKKKKFDLKTLEPFDRVLVRNYCNMEWSCDILSNIKQEDPFPYVCIGSEWKYCIPYNDGTKHLIGTSDETPEYYIY